MRIFHTSNQISSMIFQSNHLCQQMQFLNNFMLAFSPKITVKELIKNGKNILKDI